MGRKTVDIPSGSPTPSPRTSVPLFQWVRGLLFGAADPVDELREQGWRLVGRDENGGPIFAPPARYSHWL